MIPAPHLSGSNTPDSLRGSQDVLGSLVSERAFVGLHTKGYMLSVLIDGFTYIAGPGTRASIAAYLVKQPIFYNSMKSQSEQTIKKQRNSSVNWNHPD